MPTEPIQEQIEEQPAILDGAAPVESPNPPNDPVDPPAEAPAVAARPDGLADEFWDETSGVKMTELLTKMGELDAFKAEADVAATGVPEAAEGYELVVPEDLDVPEGMEVKINDDDPLFNTAKTWAHENKISQEVFNGLTSVYMKAKAAEATLLRTKVKDEMGKLGENGRARVDAVMTALNGRIGGDQAKHLAPMMFSAAQVMAFEALVRGAPLPKPLTPTPAQETVGGKAWADMDGTEKLMQGHENAKRNGQVGPIATSNPRG